MIALRRWALVAAVLLGAAPAVAAPGGSLLYPEPPRANVVDTYWGTPVPDPYRPLENADAPQTRSWLQAEAVVTRRYLDALPHRAAIRAAFERFQTGSSSETPLEQHGQFWSMSRRAAGKRNVVFVRDGALQPDRPLLDANELPPNVTIAYVDWSRSGRLLAYATETNGSDWLTWHVRDVATATDRPDVVRWGKYVDVAFSGDDGFYYSGYDAPRADGTAAGF
ncbi:MAG: prolyl oligopeptidase [Candidatus Eremiobacteraeota bacterium]|jgi:prolyl oligopeptidase|nr:prolyl oligopeptidase [Candidatus Eremiobacteraeota bacterium]